MNNTSISYTTIFKAIIREQQQVIGPLALERAKKVPGLVVRNANDISVKGDAVVALTGLVNEYAKLFGKASVEVCRDAVRTISPPIPSDKLPSILK